jgi:hypothetical protein
MNTHHRNLETGVTVSKWIKIQKEVWNFSGAILLFDKVRFYAGRSDHWGIGAEYCHYDRSLTFEILNLYAGIEILHSEKWLDPQYRSKGDLLD